METSANTWLHRLHPLVKLAWLVWLTVGVFLTDRPAFCWTVVATAGLLTHWSGRPLRSIPALRMWLICAGALILLHTLLAPSAERYAGLIARDGLARGLCVAGRLLAVVMLSALFVATTQPADLAQALARLGVPYRWCFALVTAIRLTSLFRSEAEQVYRAQIARGVPYDTGRLRSAWLLLRRLCLPLLVSALRTAQSLALAMEGRAFGRHPQRTYLRPLMTGRRDVLAGGVLVAAMIGFAYGRLTGKL